MGLGHSKFSRLSSGLIHIHVLFCIKILSCTGNCLADPRILKKRGGGGGGGGVQWQFKKKKKKRGGGGGGG